MRLRLETSGSDGAGTITVRVQTLQATFYVHEAVP
jgi:hypothetical protein